MVVEDEEPVRDLIRRHLEPSYEIVETEDATRALALALERKPDCILLDLNLPKLSGLELCTIFADMNATRLIPIIIITGDPSANFEEISKVIRFASFMQKPLDFKELKLRIAAAVEVKQVERRREPRVRLSVGLKMTGNDESGKGLEVTVITNDVSASGFSCICIAPLRIGSFVDVFMTSGQKRVVGRARVVRVEDANTPRQRFGFEFIEKSDRWVLK
ncbi:MAG TPA: response regulator [Candidatus Binatia bacterium]|nr:response regulator [Candidatus Binatia bacterium]